MVLNEFSVYELEKHETKDIEDSNINGELTVIWRDWDEIINQPQMIYLNSVNPGEIKGPHLHTKRDSFMTCIQGKVVFIVKDLDGLYHEIICDEKKPVLICIPKNFASAHINLSDKPSKILVLASLQVWPNS